mgnify:CR=1 FL=1
MLAMQDKCLLSLKKLLLPKAKKQIYQAAMESREQLKNQQEQQIKKLLQAMYQIKQVHRVQVPRQTAEEVLHQITVHLRKRKVLSCILLPQKPVF